MPHEIMNQLNASNRSFMTKLRSPMCKYIATVLAQPATTREEMKVWPEESMPANFQIKDEIMKEDDDVSERIPRIRTFSGEMSQACWLVGWLVDWLAGRILAYLHPYAVCAARVLGGSFPARCGVG